MHRVVASLLTLVVSLGFIALPAAGEPQVREPSHGRLLVSDSGVYAFDPVTLELGWRQLQDQQTFEPAVIGDRVLVTGSRGLYAIDSESGDLIWQRPSRQVGFPVVLVGETAYLTDRGGLLQAIDSDDGELLWQRRFPGWVYPPAQAGGLLFTGGSDGRLWAIDRERGDVRWAYPLGQEMVYSPVALADGRIIATTFNREVIALDHGGNLLWRQNYAAILTTPMVLDGQLIFNGLDGQLRAVDAKDGKILWRRQLPEPLAVGLEHQQGMLLAALDSGRVWVLASDSGELRQAYRLPGEPVARPRFMDGEILSFVRAFGGPKAILLTRNNH
ncbi:MAG: PQQ-binding-like beta-propeller repeat protein [Candidatus Thiodiazotropha sp. (ex Dulcina madagascariensis)]|nr:PQQ-binding-like beta-propeller repeat protein [Candidatus Thiodiazotropha sp. (ex Dulcina madagascariensis)]